MSESPPPPMRALRIFAKGNVDVRDSLLWSRASGKLEWNGLNQALREKGHRTVARIKHETAIGFAFIPSGLESQPESRVPPEALQMLPADPIHPPAAQRSNALLAASSDLVVLSLQPDLMSTRVVHKRSGVHFHAGDVSSWEPSRRLRFEEEFAGAGRCTAEESMRSLERLLDAIELKLAAPVLVYNMCPVLPGEQIDSYLGAPDALALRIGEFNLALAQLSSRRNFSIVDLQRISARAGADRVKLDIVHFNAIGWRLIAEEVVRILELRGLLGDGG